MPFRVLVVEDEPVCMGFVRRVLAQAGYVVLQAETGDEAIHLCAEINGDVDLLVSDVRLRGCTGIDTALMLKEVWPSLAVLLTSATPEEYWTEEDRQKAAAIAGASFLPKPFFPAQLRERAAMLLAQAAPAQVS